MNKIFESYSCIDGSYHMIVALYLTIKADLHGAICYMIFVVYVVRLVVRFKSF